MPKTYHISEEECKNIRTIMSATKDKNVYRRLEAIALRGEGKSNAEVAEITKYHPKRVSQLVSEYSKNGIEKISSEQRKGGNHRLLSYEAEEKFLEQFAEKAQAGQIITVLQMKEALDELVGAKSSLSTIYYILAKHGWRKIMPRSKHPKKADDEAIEASKKLTLPTKN